MNKKQGITIACIVGAAVVVAVVVMAGISIASYMTRTFPPHPDKKMVVMMNAINRRCAITG